MNAFTHHDTDQIIITPSASDDNLAEATRDLAGAQSKSTVAMDSESADNIILARGTVVLFVQDSIAEAVDRQKRNSEKKGRAKFPF